MRFVGQFVLATLATIFTAGFAETGHAQLTAKFTVDGVANCQQPLLVDFPIHIDGLGTMSTAGHANLDVDGGVTGHEVYQGKLGRKGTEVPGGTASLRVMGRSRLRARRDYPNNYLLVDLTVIGRECTIKVQNFLRPGKRQYTFIGDGGRVAYCEKPIITRTSCTPL